MEEMTLHIAREQSLSVTAASAVATSKVCHKDSQATSLILIEGGEPSDGKLSLLSILVSVSKIRYLIDWDRRY